MAEATQETLVARQETYEVLEKIGQGGFGVTHLARRRSDGKRVVVKRLKMETLDDWKTFELFEREAKVLEGLSHANIPAFIDHFELTEGDRLRGFALVQTFVEGRTLSSLESNPPGAAKLRRWFERLLEVCRYLHAQSPAVIHRDISPKNVMIRAADDEAVLIDFGAVQNVARSANTVASTSAGTFGYAAPEQLIGRAVPASDLYGLAMTYLAAATGREPETLPHVGNRIDVSSALREHDTHPRLALLLEAMTDPDPARRPNSAQDVLNRVRAIPAAAAATDATLPTAEPGDPAEALEQTWRERLRRGAAQEAIEHGPGTVPEVDDFTTLGIDETGSHALVGLDFMEGGAARLDLETFELERWQHGVSDLHHGRLWVETDGRGILLACFDRGAFMRADADGDVVVQTVRGLPSGMVGHGEPGRIALSPDGKTLACADHHNIEILDLERGCVAQSVSVDRAHISMSASIRFAPDGSALLMESFGSTFVVTPKGEVERLEDTMFAVAHDGRTVACVDENGLHIGMVERWSPFAWKEEPTVVAALEGRIDHLRFSPDDRRVAYARDGRVGVIDVRTGALEIEVGDPYRNSLPLGSVNHIGLSRDGRRLFVSASCFPHPFADQRDDCLAVYSLTRRQPLGTVLRLDDSEVPYGFTVFGLHGKLSRNAKKGRKRWERTRRLLTDEVPEAVLDEDAQAALDFADRLAFWGGKIDENSPDFERLVEASKGLTGLLPAAVSRVAQRAGEGPARFGAARLEDDYVEALAWLRSKNDAEREVLFEDMLGELRKELEAQARPLSVMSGRRFDAKYLIAAAVVVLALVGIGLAM